MTPYLRVAGVDYPKRDVLGRLPLRVFTADIPRLQAAMRKILKHFPDAEHSQDPVKKPDVYDYWSLRFNSSHRDIRTAGVKARLMALKKLEALEQDGGRLTAVYRYSHRYSHRPEHPGMGWGHQFDVRASLLIEPIPVRVPFNWNEFIVRALGEAVIGTCSVCCVPCCSDLEMSLTMYVEPGALEPAFPVLP